MAKYKFSTVVEKWADALSVEDVKAVKKYYKMFNKYVNKDDYRGWKELIDWEVIYECFNYEIKNGKIYNWDGQVVNEDEVEDSAWFDLGEYLNDLGRQTEILLDENDLEECLY